MFSNSSLRKSGKLSISVLSVLLTPFLASCAPGYVGPSHSLSFTDGGTGVIRISESYGGDVSGTWQRIRKMQMDNVLFIIDGRCASACTQVLDKNYPHVCWTDHAEFIFHGSRPNNATAPGGASLITNALLAGQLPGYVKAQLPPPNEWTPGSWHSLTADDLPDSRRCRNNERFLSMVKNEEGDLMSPYTGPPYAERRSYRDVSDDEFLSNVRNSLSNNPDIHDRLLEGATKTRPHLKTEIQQLREATDV